MQVIHEATFDGRGAIVTGAGGRIGREHALYLARRGACVVVNDIAQAAADAVAGEILAQGGTALALGASVIDERAIARIGETASGHDLNRVGC